MARGGKRPGAGRKPGAKEEVAEAPAPSTLNPKQTRFVQEYLIDLNATQAATRAGYSAATANEQGARLLAHASVAAAIAAGQAARSARTQIAADEVLRYWCDIGRADPNELVQYRRGCCRYCWGEGHRYQFTAAEYERAQAKALKGKRQDADAEEAVLDLQGGLGFDAKRDPHPDCTECFGEGSGRMHVQDSRKVKGGARLLYRGAKHTKDGLEIQMEDRAKAWENVAKHLGMFTERHEHVGDIRLVISADDAKL